MENRYKLIIDLKTKSITNNTTFKQGNAGTSVLEITIVDEGLPVNITGQTVKFNFLRSDNAVVSQDGTTGVTILDALTGKFECVLQDASLAIDGKVEAEIVFTEGTDVLSSTTFVFYVDTSIGLLSIKYIASVTSKLEEWQNTFDFDEVSRANEFITSQFGRSTTFTASEAARTTVFNAAEDLRETGEASRVTSETGRVNTFNANETSRSTTFTANETSRSNTFNANETSRSNTFNAAEALRELGETGRVTAFNANETSRSNTFNAAEDLREERFEVIQTAVDNVASTLSLGRDAILISTYVGVGNESFVPINLPSYNPDSDYFDVIYNGDFLTKDMEYAENENGLGVDLLGWTLDLDDTVVFRVHKAIVDSSSGAIAGSQIQAGGVTDIELSNVSGNIKERFEAYKADYATVVKGFNNQAIYDAVIDAKANNRDVYFPSGVYTLTPTAYLATAISLLFSGINGMRFYGAKDAIIKASDTSSNIMFAFSQCHNIDIDGLTFDGNRTPSATTNINDCLNFSWDCTNISIQNCKFQNVGDMCVRNATQSLDSANWVSITDTVKSYFTLNNCRFENVKGCFVTKLGGAKYGTISNNHVHHSLSGFKIDSETYALPSEYTSYPNPSSGWIIHDNTFTDMTTSDANNNIGFVCITLEEGIENIIVHDNVFENITNIDCISINNGQSGKYVSGINIHNNLFNNLTNSFGIVSRNDLAGSVVVSSNISIHDNTFKKANSSFIFLKCDVGGGYKEVSIKDNKFYDWSLVAPLAGVAQEAVNIWGSSLMEGLVLKDNKFIRLATVFVDKPGLVLALSNVADVSEVVIRGNTLKGATEATYLMNITTTKCIVEDNLFKNGAMNLYGAMVHFIKNRLVKSKLLVMANATPSTLNFEENRLYRNGASYNYSLKVSDGSVVTGFGNKNDPSIPGNGIYLESGTFTDNVFRA